MQREQQVMIEHRRSRQGGGWRRSLAAAGMALALVGVAACSDDDGETALQEAEESGTADSLVGQTVTVSGDVDRVIEPGVFLIGGDFVSLGYNEGTLVYGAENADVAEGGRVQVTGVVERFVSADVSEAYDLALDESDPLVVAYEEEFAIAAESVEFIPEEVVESDDDTTLEESAEAGTADSLVGQTITVGGEVEEVLTPEAFRIGGTNPESATLVLDASGTPVEVGGAVEVTGTVVEFVIADIETDYDLVLDDEVYVELDDQFAVVADTVEFVPEN